MQAATAAWLSVEMNDPQEKIKAIIVGRVSLPDPRIALGIFLVLISKAGRAIYFMAPFLHEGGLGAMCCCGFAMWAASTLVANRAPRVLTGVKRIRVKRR